MVDQYSSFNNYTTYIHASPNNKFVWQTHLYEFAQMFRDEHSKWTVHKFVFNRRLIRRTLMYAVLSYLT